MAVIGLAIGLAGPSRDLLVRRVTLAGLGKSAYGRVYGLVYSGLDVGLAASPVLFGWLLDHGMPRGVLLGVAALQVVAVVAALVIARRAAR
jgi:MFS family permease